MTTLTIAAPARICRVHPVMPRARERRGAAPTRVRLTPRGRGVLTLASLLVGLVVAGTALLGGAVSATANPAAGQAPSGWSTYVVQPGDTLWTLAAETVPGEDPRVLVAEIREVNGLSGSALHVGQVLALPHG